MTDRHAGYLVVLDTDVREDDAEEIITALSMIKGVAEVTPVAADPQAYITRKRRDRDWEATMLTLYQDGPAEAGR